MKTTTGAKRVNNTQGKAVTMVKQAEKPCPFPDSNQLELLMDIVAGNAELSMSGTNPKEAKWFIRRDEDGVANTQFDSQSAAWLFNSGHVARGKSIGFNSYACLITSSGVEIAETEKYKRMISSK